MQSQLSDALEHLKKVLQTAYELKVVWIPTQNSKISGQVKGNYIYIYDEEKDMALETLKHEFLDYAISKVIEPYKEVTNRLIALINDDAYHKKEKLISTLSDLI